MRARATRLRYLLVSALLVVTSTCALAQDKYPSRPVRIIVPSTAGGSSDTGSRLIAQEGITGRTPFPDSGVVLL